MSASVLERCVAGAAVREVGDTLTFSSARVPCRFFKKSLTYLLSNDT